VAVRHPRGAAATLGPVIDTSGRHQSVTDAVRGLDSQHLSDDLAQASRIVENAASQLLGLLSKDGPRLTEALNLLRQAKDSAVIHYVATVLDAERGTPVATLAPGETHRES
jgi:hypothetical protein